ncbi:hypothetical protein [Actinophytocola sp.]|uniref:hypothetical protein n=1 Tax=Actinophytocola sp. TaxID=1872138 RepID=UPI002ED0B3C4
MNVPSSADRPLPRYEGPALEQTEEEIIQLGGCVFLPPNAVGARRFSSGSHRRP